MKVLYNSNEVHKAIGQVLSAPQDGDKRKILVAYVGTQAEAYLPDPDGLEIVCCLKPGATDALALKRLQRRKAKLFKSAQLHMKVYWSSRNGCVICSANASGAALGKNSQKEVGVYLSSGEIDIERLWRYAKPTTISPADLKRLNKQASRIPRDAWDGSKTDAPPDFLEWQSEQLGDWKLGWWTEGAEFAQASIETANRRFGVIEPYDFLNCGKAHYKPNDWVLSFDWPKAKSVSWLYIDFKVPLNKTYTDFHHLYPYQAVQARAPKLCPRPPFKLDGAFKSAFRKALIQVDPEKIEHSRSLRPTNLLIRTVAGILAPKS